MISKSKCTNIPYSSVKFNVSVKEEVMNSLCTSYKKTLLILYIFHLSKPRKNIINFEVGLLNISQKMAVRYATLFTAEKVFLGSHEQTKLLL